MSEDYTCNSVYIPEELIVEILKRLPAKSLIRFMSVCKSWYFLITNPNFKSTHLNHQITITNSNAETRFLMYGFTATKLRDLYVLYRDNDEFNRHLELICPRVGLDVSGFCHGIVCLARDFFRQTSVVLWNPSLGKCLDLVVPHDIESDFVGENLDPDEPNDVELFFAHGFGFDAATNDYKVVTIAYFASERDDETRIVGVYVYSLNEGNWRFDPASISLDCFCRISFPGVYVNGVIYWMVIRIFDDEFNDVRKPTLIMAFDLTNETLGGIPPPEYSTKLMTFEINGRELLAVVVDEDETYRVCVMEEDGVENSWLEIYSLNIISLNYVGVVNVRRNGEVVLRRFNDGLVSVLFCDGRARIKRVSSRSMCYVGTYVESLLLL